MKYFMGTVFAFFMAINTANSAELYLFYSAKSDNLKEIGITKKEVANVFDGEKEVTDELLSSTLEETMDICTRALGDAAKEPRIEMLISRLKNNLSLVVKSLADEFSVSKFKPAFFELKIGKL